MYSDYYSKEYDDKKNMTTKSIEYSNDRILAVHGKKTSRITGRFFIYRYVITDNQLKLVQNLQITEYTSCSGNSCFLVG